MDNGEKGLKVIVLSMFVFAVAVTVALFIQIAAGTNCSTNSYLPCEIMTEECLIVIQIRYYKQTYVSGD